MVLSSPEPKGEDGLSRPRAAKESVRFHLFDDCVYAYEYALANRELFSLTHEPNLPSGLSDGYVETPLDGQRVPDLVKRLAYYDRIEANGSTSFTHQKTLSGITGAIQASSGKAYMTHWIYPYKGKFHPQMIRALLNIMGVESGQKVLDPMTGSGTLNVEASLMGIDSIGIDCLPIAVLTARVKYNLLKDKIAAGFVEALPKRPPSNPARLERFLDNEPEERAHSKDSDVNDVIQLLHFEALSISQLPNRDFATVWTKIAAYYRDTALQCPKVIKDLGLTLGEADIRLGDSRKLDIKSESIDGIITSPPYAIALDYVARNELQLQTLGYSMDEIYENTIGLRSKKRDQISNYYDDLDTSIREMYRVLRSGRFCVIVIGDTRFDGKVLPTVQRTIDMTKQAGFRLSANMRKVSAGRFGLFKTESMLLFQKSD
jgi:hypothetical protein